jgi:hypothetical protein
MADMQEKPPSKRTPAHSFISEHDVENPESPEDKELQTENNELQTENKELQIRLTESAREREQHVTGVKLVGLIGATTLIVFLMLLDMSIVATVSLIRC